MIYAPGFSTYIDLTPYDIDAQTIIDNALAAAAVRVPEWDPKEGHLEVAIIEAVAQEIEEAVYAINRLPREILKGVLRLAGVVISDGVAPVATATFTALDTLGHDVPSGTRVRYRSAGRVPVELIFRTTASGTIAPGATTVTVPIAGDTKTSAANGAPILGVLDIVDDQTWLAKAELASVVTDGEDPETEADYLDRGATMLSRLTDSLVLPAHYQAAAIEWPGVSRATVSVNHVPPGAAGDSLGNIAVFVAAAGGVAASSGLKSALGLSLTQRSRADLIVGMYDINIVTVPVAATVRRKAEYPRSLVQASCEAAIAAYLNPDSWTFGADVEPAELIAVLDRDAVGVDLVMEVPAVSVAIGPQSLAKAGAITITVVEP